MLLTGRNIILGVTGSIAAYKSAVLIRELIKSGANVKVIMTPAAKEFITPLTLSTLSKNPVITDFFNGEGTWSNHVDLASWADLMLIAPASANTIAAMANGFCSNMLLATYLSAKCPVYYAPAMDLEMYRHPSTKKNIEILNNLGNVMIDPGTGELASGLIGEGRMEEPIDIVEIICNHLKRDLPLNGKRILITAGPTYEAIDPVRFIGNHSSGKMGFAIAREAAKQGAEVTLVAGPVALENIQGVNRIDVTSSDEMFQASKLAFENTDIAILSAAVADYKSKSISELKIKKEEQQNFQLELEPTKDILAEISKLKKPNQFLVGFALETNNEMENARNKLKRKNLDMIVLNSLKENGAGFKGNTNKVTIIHKDNNFKEFGLKTKPEVAKDIIEEILSAIRNA